MRAYIICLLFAGFSAGYPRQIARVHKQEPHSKSLESSDILEVLPGLANNHYTKFVRELEAAYPTTAVSPSTSSQIRTTAAQLTASGSKPTSPPTSHSFAPTQKTIYADENASVAITSNAKSAAIEYPITAVELPTNLHSKLGKQFAPKSVTAAFTAITFDASLQDENSAYSEELVEPTSTTELNSSTSVFSSTPTSESTSSEAATSTTSPTSEAQAATEIQRDDNNLVVDVEITLTVVRVVTVSADDTQSTSEQELQPTATATTESDEPDASEFTTDSFPLQASRASHPHHRHSIQTTIASKIRAKEHFSTYILPLDEVSAISSERRLKSKIEHFSAFP
ncbi:hypothetical protein GGI25_004004 [Coemansia spiralis]|uniref:Uncharacterized protein n=1 Tax=Coemansia spiralis TaxID=417178 RepID=A0A9W8KXH5_9FUNG|nr:hypothetical protein BX070DRAFT_228120 [Coemansia spiralis]KAJ2623801.1 hypothetical protein GGI26_002039 [Coemansia sp. RSA 1358]KAJ2675266.1 hypothetical protein GGI25_004004 [Coemansia spiralis]